MNIEFFFKGKLSREEASSAFLATLLKQTDDEGKFIKDFFKLFRDLPKWVTKPIPKMMIEDLTIEEFEEIKTEEDNIDIAMKGSNYHVLIENKVKSASKTNDQMKTYYVKQIEKHKSKNIIFIYLAPTELTAKSEIKSLKLRDNDYAIPMKWAKIFDIIETNKKLKDNEFCSSGEKEIRELLKTDGKKYPDTENRMKLKNIRDKGKDLLKKKYPELVRQKIGFMDWEGDDYIQFRTSNSNLTHENKLIFDQNGDFDPIIDDPKSEKKIELKIRLGFKISDYGVKNTHMKKKWDEIRNSGTTYVIKDGQSEYTYERNIEDYYVFIKKFLGTEKELQQSMLKQSVIILDHFKEYLPATICINDKCPKIGKKRRILYLHDVNKKKNEEIWKCKKCEEERIFRIPTESIKETAKVCTYCGR